MSSDKKANRMLALILVALALGAISGYGAGYFIQNKRISELESQLMEAEQDLKVLNDSFAALNKSYSTLARLAAEVHEIYLKVASESAEAFYAFSASMYEERTEKQIDLLEEALHHIDACIPMLENLSQIYQELSKEFPVHRDIYEKYGRFIQAELKFMYGERKLVNATILLFRVILEVEEADELQKDRWLSMLEESKEVYEEALDLMEEASRIAPEIRMKYEAEELHINYLLDLLYEFKDILTEA